jgi:hypothetical protein
MALDNGQCDRCGKATRVHIMSFFNTDDLCIECVKKEREHPMYATAQEVEREAVANGDYNYGGIGKPPDL